MPVNTGLAQISYGLLLASLITYALAMLAYACDFAFSKERLMTGIPAEVPAEQPELVGVALIIFTPVFGLLQHQGFHRGREVVPGRPRVENARNAIEPVECFA